MPNLAEIARSQACAASTISVQVEPLRLAPYKLPKPPLALRILAHAGVYAVCSALMYLSWSNIQ